MNWLKDTSSWKGLLIHITVITLIAVISISFFFYIYLPISTNHGETITVPDVIGVDHDQLEQYLTRRKLRYEVTEDSSYSPNYPALAVLMQFPLPNSKVKENRRVYVTLNSTTPPSVKMPDLIDGSMKNAQMVLKAYDLKLGKTEYVPDMIFNSVLKQQLDGREVLPGEKIPKGSVIDVVLGDGFGNQSLESPNLITLDEESALFAITGSALKIGKVQYEQEGIAVIVETDEDGNEKTTEIQVAAGEVFKQDPKPGKSMKIKDIVHIWVYKPDSLNQSPSILDQQ